MELEQLYTGGSFPQYLHGDPLFTLGVPIQPEIGGPVETTWLYLPAPEQQIARTLERIGINSVCGDVCCLDQYEFVEGVTSDKELGGWLVEHGLAGVDFPQAVRPYLDYAGIGAEYYANHGGAYTPNGYVKCREPVQEQAVAEESKFVLTLMSISDAYRLSLPTSGDEILDMLDGFTDFDALGRCDGVPSETQRSGFAGERSRSEMSEPCPKGRTNDMKLAATKQDGVRETSFGSVRRLSSPFPQPDIGPTMC